MTPRKFKDEDLIFLRKLGFNVLECSQMLSCSYDTASIHHSRLVSEGYCEKSAARGVSPAKKRKAMLKVEEEIIKYLKKNGPSNMRELRGVIMDMRNVASMTARDDLRKILAGKREKFRIIRFSIGKNVTSAKFRSHQVLNGLSVSKMGPVIWLQGDTRIISFVGSKVMKPETTGQAKSLTWHLRRYFDRPTSRKIIKFAGYKYKDKKEYLKKYHKRKMANLTPAQKVELKEKRSRYQKERYIRLKAQKQFLRDFLAKQIPTCISVEWQTGKV